MPSAIALKKNKASNGAVSAFLVSTPEIGVDSFLLSYALMGGVFTTFRMIMAFCCSIVVGLMQFIFNSAETFSIGPSDVKEIHQHKMEKTFKTEIFKAFSYTFGKLMNDMATWLLIGFIFSALVESFLPEHFFSSFNPYVTKLMIVILGIPMYICASASTPMALSLMIKGLSPGNAMLLLLVGPATNITNIMVMKNYIGLKGVLLNIISITVVGLIFSSLVDLYFSHYPYVWKYITLSHHSHHPSQNAPFYSYLPGLGLIFLLMKGIYYEHFSHHHKHTHS